MRGVVPIPKGSRKPLRRPNVKVRARPFPRSNLLARKAGPLPALCRPVGKAALGMRRDDYKDIGSNWSPGDHFRI